MRVALRTTSGGTARPTERAWSLIFGRSGGPWRGLTFHNERVLFLANDANRLTGRASPRSDPERAPRSFGCEPRRASGARLLILKVKSSSIARPLPQPSRYRQIPPVATKLLCESLLEVKPTRRDRHELHSMNVNTNSRQPFSVRRNPHSSSGVKHAATHGLAFFFLRRSALSMDARRIGESPVSCLLRK